MAASANLIILAAGDNVGIALRDIAAGEIAATLPGVTLRAEEAIPQGHKLALDAIAEGQDIVRFGMKVALASAAIGKGRLVHVHNVTSRYLNNDEDHYE
ncbi:UxaA family hydrolase [Ancylobacter sp. FA202]|uniref:UxaA family hydrolase n=1 Tax=Ancylobacter sp. FA202 TaxID=1111106 RepID=UPI000376350D|nr:UxaA family hydrolase [Ancylobacter sp. FA202]